MRRPPNWFFVAAVILAAGSVQAAETAGRTAIGLQTGLMKLGGGDRDYSNIDQHLTLDLRRGLSPGWSLELALKYGWVRPGSTAPGEDAGWTFDSTASLYTVIWQPRLGVLYHLAPGRRVSPYLGLAAGLTSWRVKDLRGEDGAGINPAGTTVLGYDEDGVRDQLKGNDLTGTVTAGLQLFASRSLAFDLGARYHLFPGNQRDNIGLSDDWYFWGPQHVDANKSMVEGFAGLTFFFGGRDRDGDGIPNRLDLCPDEPEDYDGFEDGDGCPDPDNDGDGICDPWVADSGQSAKYAHVCRGRDRCPDAPEDFDGFEDEDGCPDPDNDGDGICDPWVADSGQSAKYAHVCRGRDLCPDAPEDLDGFEDEDGCPDPDNDGDGVLDADDECPGTPPGAVVDERGCEVRTEQAAAPAPPVEDILAGRDEVVLEGVTFVSGSAQLAGASLEVLRRVAASLIAHPEVIIEVRGHTDDAGTAESNRDLSQRRAIAVRDQLIQLGVSPLRMTAVGYGEDYPIASNDTAAGRAANRRVEIHRVER